MTKGIYILLGSNLGDRKGNLVQAISMIKEFIGPIIKQSSIYETAAWGKTDQPSFYNQVIEVESAQNPNHLLEKVLKIEKKLGRVRKEKWGERTMDIDILYFHDQVIDTPRLKVPHPGIPERRFTLAPLVEIAPEFVHPILKKSNKLLLEQCEDGLAVHKL